MLISENQPALMFCCTRYALAMIWKMLYHWINVFKLYGFRFFINCGPHFRTKYKYENIMVGIMMGDPINGKLFVLESKKKESKKQVKLLLLKLLSKEEFRILTSSLVPIIIVQFYEFHFRYLFICFVSSII